MKHARLIVNPASGNSQPTPMRLPEIVAALEAVDIRADIAFTKVDEPAAAIAQQAVAEGYDLVIVGGGDGTVAEVAKGLLYAPIPLGVVPIGTYNNLARSLRIPTDLTEACSVLAQGQIKSIDVGLANNTHYFFEAAGVGLDAVLFPIGEKIKGGSWSRILQAVQLIVNYQPQQLQIQLERPIFAAPEQPPRLRWLKWRRLISHRQHLRLRALLVVVANSPYYGTAFTVAPDAIMDDGLMTVSVFRNFSKWELIRHFWAISLGQYHYSPKLETYSAAEVQITANAPIPVHIDGNPIGELPLQIKTMKHALKVMVPAVENLVELETYRQARAENAAIE